MSKPGKLYIITGPTASGKSLIVSRLIQLFPQLFRVTTTTTRHKRAGEVDGQDYFFLHRSDFEDRVAKNYFIEHVEYAGYLYGTGKDQLEKVVNGHDVIWIIDPFRAAHIKELISQAFPASVARQILQRTVVVYLNASEPVRKKRLIKRGTTEEGVKSRFQRDRQVWKKFHGRFPIVIENSGPIEDTIELILSHLKSTV